DGLGRVVVTGDDVVDPFGRMVGINHGHDGDAQRAGFGHGDLVVADVNDEQRVGQAVHVFDAADGLVEFVELALEQQAFFLDHALGATVGDDGFHFLLALDRGFDGLEVGEHAAPPAGVYIVLAAAGGFGGLQFTGCALGAVEKDVAATGRELLDEVGTLFLLDY